LGAWTSLSHQPKALLDIGAGTGVIALQLAQRSPAPTIDAVEIDEEAHVQCVDNFEASPWADRLFCYHASIQEFASEIDENYDLIVSNPPFYSEDYKTKDSARDIARFNDVLPFEHLIACVAQLLANSGIFAVIVPKKEEANFLSLAEKYSLFPKRICRVRGNLTSEEKRSLMEFSSQKTTVISESLTIENARHDYTTEYTQLVQDFYLKM